MDFGTRPIRRLKTEGGVYEKRKKGNLQNMSFEREKRNNRYKTRRQRDGKMHSGRVLKFKR